VAKTTEASLKEITVSFQNYKTILEQKVTELKSSLEFAQEEKEGSTFSLQETMEDLLQKKYKQGVKEKVRMEVMQALNLDVSEAKKQEDHWKQKVNSLQMELNTMW